MIDWWVMILSLPPAPRARACARGAGSKDDSHTHIHLPPNTILVTERRRDAHACTRKKTHQHTQVTETVV
jgi:hypothetical protein